MDALLEVRSGTGGRLLSVAYGEGGGGARRSLSVQPGEIVTVIGPNGAGKTTLLAAVRACCAPRRLAVPRRAAAMVGRAERGARAGAGARAARAVRRDEPSPTTSGSALRRRASGERSRRTDGRGLRHFPRLRRAPGQVAGTLSGGERQMLAMDAR